MNKHCWFFYVTVVVAGFMVVSARENVPLARFALHCACLCLVASAFLGKLLLPLCLISIVDI